MLESDEFYEDLNQQGQALAQTLLDGSNTDAAAFDKVMEAYRLPKETDEQKAARSAAIQKGIIGATETPLHTAENCARVLALAQQLEGRSNVNAASDLDCAIYLATAALKGALSNAEINIDTIKDAETVKAFNARVAELKKSL
jgi:formiminotetrahydrofolate cyclodeaminase